MEEKCCTLNSQTFNYSYSKKVLNYSIIKKYITKMSHELNFYPHADFSFARPFPTHYKTLQLKKRGSRRKVSMLYTCFFSFGGGKVFAVMVHTHHSCTRLVLKCIYVVDSVVSAEIINIYDPYS